MNTRTHAIVLVVLLACVGVILVITFWPTPVDRPFDAELSRIFWRLHHAYGVPGWVNYSLLESGSNVIMFIPLGALIALYIMQPLWWVSGVLGLTLSLCIELGQDVFLPHRFASAGDLAANTAGALIGGGIVAIARRGEPQAS